VLGEQSIVPSCAFSKLVVCDHEGFGLKLSQVFQKDGGHFLDAKQPRCLQAFMPGSDLKVAIYQDGNIETECFNAFGELSDLSVAVKPRIRGIELELINGTVDDLKVRLGLAAGSWNGISLSSGHWNHGPLSSERDVRTETKEVIGSLEGNEKSGLG